MVVNRTILARTHIIPALGARKLAQLSAEEVEDHHRDGQAGLPQSLGCCGADQFARITPSGDRDENPGNTPAVRTSGNRAAITSLSTPR
jgi:hypothetical protein